MTILLHATALHFNNIELLMLDEKTGILLCASELYLNNKLLLILDEKNKTIISCYCFIFEY